MFVRRSLMVFALALSVARCADQPTAASRAPASPQFLAWAGATPQFTSTAIRPSSARSGSAALMTPPVSMDQYTVSFWAVRGESRSIQINYASSIDSDTHPFLSLTTTDPQFGAPAQLKIWYGGAAGDYNGDGVIDDTDAQVESQLLGLWYREGQADAWTQLSATQSLDEKSFTYALPHFCEYAVAELLEWAVSW